ncbi:MAG: hypothetical protein VST66_01925 [Nitrospirota bacterium]|nr:hypothetical protein [Nitrospirota bacterium]
MASSNEPEQQSSSSQSQKPPETELLNVIVDREGQNVNAKWGLHPKLKEDLRPEEWKELTDLMQKVTSIVGTRFSEILSQNEKGQSGTA